MKIAILSDIHSNAFALQAVLNDLPAHQIDRIWVAGDIFGYYPWACETYDLLKPFIQKGTFIKGNHDQLLLDADPPSPVPVYWNAAKQNAAVLLEKRPEALPWLQSLSFECRFTVNGKQIRMVHGTPADPENGRFYPDDSLPHSWFPVENELLITGHTHYPLLRRTESGGIIINPGSVGQPRDGDPMPGWLTWDDESNEFHFQRSRYDHLEVMGRLRKMDWDERSIKALNKRQPGSL